MRIVLKYMGTGEWIALVPNRDLTDYDIVYTAQRKKQSEQSLIDDLCSRGLYQVIDEFYCEVCGKSLKSEKALIRHELTHITKQTGEEQSDGNSINSTKKTNTDRE